MTPPPMLAALGEEIDDPDIETFLLFTQSRPSQDLGYVDKTKTTLELCVDGRDFAIQQSPTLLSSDRAEGTTGAVLWKITPLFAAWTVSPSNILFKSGIINKDATVLELGCGTSAVIPLMLSPYVGSYIATDMEYVINGNLLRKNFMDNQAETPSSQQKSKYGRHRPKESRVSKADVEFLALNWESSVITDLSKHCQLSHDSVDVVIACDCVYNEVLIPPLVRTFADICRLRSKYAEQPTLCIIAQQLRSDAVFGLWLSAFYEQFFVCRIFDDLLPSELKNGSGFAIHVGIVRES